MDDGDKQRVHTGSLVATRIVLHSEHTLVFPIYFDLVVAQAPRVVYREGLHTDEREVVVIPSIVASFLLSPELVAHSVLSTQLVVSAV